jgi:hypothetical protein
MGHLLLPATCHAGFNIPNQMIILRTETDHAVHLLKTYSHFTREKTGGLQKCQELNQVCHYITAQLSFQSCPSQMVGWYFVN